MRNSVKVVTAVGATVVVALVLWWQNRPEPAPEKPAVEAAAPATEASTGTTAGTAPEKAETTATAEPSKPARQPGAAPEFDIVRISPDGQAVIAGRAAPGEEVEILLDGVVIGFASADAAGEFAAVLDIPPSTGPRTLLLRVAATGAAGETVALAPQQPAAETSTAATETAADATAAREAEKVADAVAKVAEQAMEKAETARQAAEAAVEDRLDAEGAEATRAAEDAAEAERQAAEAAEAARQAAEAAEAARKAAENAEAARLALESAEAARKAAEKAEADRLAAAAEAAKPTEVTAGSAATGATETAAEPDLGRFVASTPVIILPQEDADKAPVLVRPDKDDVTLLQPAETEPGAGIALDRITYTDQGDLVAAGRGAANTLIRIYANAVLKAEVLLEKDGTWQARIDADIAEATQLLRFDVVDSSGKVISRLETPFEYSPEASVQKLRDRKIVVQKGDYLWKFAEQYYGEGIRYSVIFSANSSLIRDPDLIYPGQVFTVPELVTSQ